jgi:hypothetical protein
LALYLRNSPLFRASDILIFLPFLLVSAVGSAVLWSPIVRRYTEGKGWLAGILLGVFLPILAGFIYMKLYPSFENGPVFLGSLIMTLPSAIGGGVAGWLRSRSERQLAGTPLGPL